MTGRGNTPTGSAGEVILTCNLQPAHGRGSPIGIARFPYNNNASRRRINQKILKNGVKRQSSQFIIPSANHAANIDETKLGIFCDERRFGQCFRGAFSSIKCVSRKVGGEELVAKVAANDSKKRDELIREFSVLRPLQQENVVRLVSGYQTPQQVCLVMERLYGDNVVQHLSFKNTYTEEAVAVIIQQVLDAVQYLHHCGVAHLNLQPSSVMLASRRRHDVKLVDFSLARSITSPEGSHMPKMGFPDFLCKKIFWVKFLQMFFFSYFFI